jgi:hypothetical protein
MFMHKINNQIAVTLNKFDLEMLQQENAAVLKSIEEDCTVVIMFVEEDSIPYEVEICAELASSDTSKIADSTH